MYNLEVPYDIIKELIINGIRYKYLSYDHKKTLEWLNNIHNYPNNPNFNNTVRYIPNEFKNQFPIWQTGRIWELKFNRIGEIVKVYIGKNPKYKKAFYVNDFGIKFKPMLFLSDDKHNLIANHFAIEEEL